MINGPGRAVGTAIVGCQVGIGCKELAFQKGVGLNWKDDRRVAGRMTVLRVAGNLAIAPLGLAGGLVMLMGRTGKKAGPFSLAGHGLKQHNRKNHRTHKGGNHFGQGSNHAQVLSL